MRDKNELISTAVTECCSASFCCFLCCVNAAVMTTPKIAVDILSTLLCLFNREKMCFASRYEILYYQTLSEMAKEKYHLHHAYHTIERGTDVYGCTKASCAPYAHLLFLARNPIETHCNTKDMHSRINMQ